MLTAHLSAIEEAVRALYQKTIFVPNVPETRDIRNHVIDRNAVKALIDSSFNRETVLNAVARARFDFHHDVEEDWIECGVNTEGYLRPINTHFDDSRREFLNYLGKGFRFDPNNFAFYRPTCGSTEAQTASLHEFINRRRCADSAERPLVIACRDGHIANLAKKLIVADVKEYDNPCDINAILLEFKERCVKICLSYPLEDIDDETFENLLECLDAQENVEVLLDVTGFTPGSNIALKHSCIKDVTFSLDSHLGLDTDYMGFYLHSTFGLNKRLTSGEIDEPTFAKEKNAVFSPLYGHMWFMNLHSMREATGLLKELNDETLLPHDAEKSIESKSRVKNALWDGNLKYCLSQEGFSDEEVTEIVCALHNARADIIWQSLETRMQNAVKLIDTWFDWAKDTVMPDRSSFMYAYPTNGASESIRTVINDFGIGAKRHPLVCTFNAEYEGFSAYAKAAHIEVRQLNRGKTEQDWRDVIDKISELSRTRDVLFGVTQPSSLNGCIWSEFNAFMQELSDRAPSISVMLDITYLGCTAERIPRILTDFAVVKNIAFSLSKPGGMYYDRIGGLLSKHARPSLEANARHLNPDSVLYGIQWMKDYAAGEIPGKYRQVTEKLTEQLNALLKTLARKYPELTMPVMRTSDVMGIVYGEPSKNPSELERYYTRYSAEGIPLLVRMNTTPSLAVAVGNDIAPDTEKIIDMLLQEKALCEPYAFEKKILNDPMGEYVKLRARLDQDGPLAPFPELEPVVRKLIEKLEGGEVVRIARIVGGEFSEKTRPAAVNRLKHVTHRFKHEEWLEEATSTTYPYTKQWKDAYPYAPTIDAVGNAVRFLDALVQVTCDNVSGHYFSSRYTHLEQALMFDPNYMIIPSAKPLDFRNLIQMRGVPMVFFGVVTDCNPVFGDGFFNSPYDFWVHDMNHARRNKAKNELYFKRCHISSKKDRDRKYEEWNAFIQEHVLPLTSCTKLDLDKAGIHENARRTEINIRKMMKIILFELFFEYAYVPELQSVIDAFNFVPNTKTEFEEFETSDGLGRTTDHEKSYGAGFNATVVYTEKPCPHFLTLVKHKLGKFYDTPLSKRYKDLPPVEERTPNMVFEATKRIIDYFGIREQITYTDEQMRSIIANIGEDGSKLSELPLYLGDRGEPFEPARRQFCYDRNFNLDAYRNARDHKRVKGSDAEKIIPFSKEGKIRRSLSI